MQRSATGEPIFAQLPRQRVKNGENSSSSFSSSHVSIITSLFGIGMDMGLATARFWSPFSRQGSVTRTLVRWVVAKVPWPLGVGGHESKHLFVAFVYLVLAQKGSSIDLNQQFFFVCRLCGNSDVPGRKTSPTSNFWKPRGISRCQSSFGGRWQKILFWKCLSQSVSSTSMALLSCELMTSDGPLGPQGQPPKKNGVCLCLPAFFNNI